MKQIQETKQIYKPIPIPHQEVVLQLTIIIQNRNLGNKLISI